MNKIEKAIIKTLAFFEIFSRPLTLEELWHFLYKCQTSKLQVLMGLRSLQRKKIIVKKDSYFLFSDNKKALTTFLNQKDICQKRFEKVRKTVKFLRYAPFVKNVSIINSLAFKASNINSDIDIFIVASKNHLWSCRAFVITILEILGQNKNKWYKADKFCLGFAVDEEKLDLADLCFKDDIYFTYWLATLHPVFDRKIYQKLIAQNSWIFNSLPNWQAKNISITKEKKTKLEKILSGNFGKRLEEFLSNLQIKKIQNEKENNRPGASVIANSQIMKLHAYDKRESYRNLWQERLKELKI
ncbi:MAG: hypothetical protein WCV58_01540 [Patescibacteria group bacterium]